MNYSFFRKLRAAALFLSIVVSTSFVSSQVYSHTRLSDRSVSGNLTTEKIIRQFRRPSIDERNIFILVNYQRKKRKLGKLRWSNELGKMARDYSRRMAEEDFFDHYDSDGKSVVDRAKSSEIKGWTKIGENLFFSEGYISPSTLAVTGWLDSPTHRINMLDKEWTHTGIGIYEKKRKTYVTQVFITR